MERWSRRLECTALKEDQNLVLSIFMFSSQTPCIQIKGFGAIFWLPGASGHVEYTGSTYAVRAYSRARPHNTLYIYTNKSKHLKIFKTNK